MKNIFKILPLCFLLTILSCTDNDGKVYQGNVGDFTFLSFDKTVYDLEVIVDSEGTLIIPLKSSALSSVDRSYAIELIEESSFADPTTYSLPASVTIPANKYYGDIIITGQDLGLVSAMPKNFVFKIVGLSDKEFMDNPEVTIRVLEVCPLFDDFIGNYVVTPLEFSDFWEEFMPAGSVVNVISTGEFSRKFTNPNFLINGYSLDFTFTLNCTEVNAGSHDTTIWCGEGAYYSMGPGTTPGSYDPYDDSEIIVTYSDNTLGACGQPTTQAKFKLTKL